MSGLPSPSSPDLQYLRRHCGHILKERADLPGKFTVCPGVEMRWAGEVVERPDYNINICLFDPDQENLPFHRSAEFLVMPEELRLEFLFRNPDFVKALIEFFNAVHRRAGQKPAEGLESADFNIQQILSADTYLAEKYGLGTVWYGEKGETLDPPGLYVWPSYPQAPLYSYTGGTTERARRRWAHLMAERRRDRAVKAPRCLSGTHYQQLLRVWDLREGWTGKPSVGYDGRQEKPLREVAHICREAIGTVRNQYERAFLLVTGEQYAPERWFELWGPIKVSRTAGWRRPKVGKKTRAAGGASAAWENNAAIDEALLWAEMRMDLEELLAQGLANGPIAVKLELPVEVVQGYRQRLAGDL
jgi:hypothetical protein